MSCLYSTCRRSFRWPSSFPRSYHVPLTLTSRADLLEKFNVLAGHIAQVLQRMPPRLHAVAVHPGALPADRVRQTPQLLTDGKPPLIVPVLLNLHAPTQCARP